MNEKALGVETRTDSQELFLCQKLALLRFNIYALAAQTLTG